MIYQNTISSDLKNIIDQSFLMEGMGDMRLGGGTALSLQLGHRISVDADFFFSTDFDKDVALKKVMSTFANVSDINQGPFGLFLKINGIKVDFLSWNIPFIRKPVVFGNWALLDPAEIAAMKLFAILQRGEKKDYIDLAELLQTFTLSQLLSFYVERHPNSDPALPLKFLSSYSDLNNQPMANMLNGRTWEDTKSILQIAIREYLKD